MVQRRGSRANHAAATYASWIVVAGFATSVCISSCSSDSAGHAENDTGSEGASGGTFGGGAAGEDGLSTSNNTASSGGGRDTRTTSSDAGGTTSANTSGVGGTGLGGVGHAGENAGGEAGEGSYDETGPRLTSLNIQGTRLPLQPAFDAERLRYVAYPTNPAEPLTITAVADSGSLITIDGQAAESGVPFALPDVKPNTTFEVTVTAPNGATRAYVVVYVPIAFPELRVTVSKPEASTDPIYVTPLRGGSRFAIKFDHQGVPLFYKAQPAPAFDFKKHPNGLYSYAAAQGAGAALHQILDSDYQLVDEVATIGLGQTDEHEFLILPNGNFVVLGYIRTIRDLTSYGGPEEFEVVDGVLQELTPERDVVFEWSTWGNAPYDEGLSPSEVDYAHLNSVFVDTDGNWILSLRGLSQVIKIDRETGEVLWRFSGLSNDFAIEGDPYGGICGQHSVSRLENGNLLVFDNGLFCNPNLPVRDDVTRVVEYSLDEENLTAELVWSYSRDGLLADTQGSAQRLANGNTLIGWGDLAQRAAVLVTEVTPSGEVVYEVEAYVMDGSTPTSYRAWRFTD